LEGQPLPKNLPNLALFFKEPIIPGAFMPSKFF